MVNFQIKTKAKPKSHIEKANAQVLNQETDCQLLN